MIRGYIRPKVGRRTRAYVSTSGNVGVTHRRRRGAAWVSARGSGVSIGRGLFKIRWRS
jgi:hypothetical protein